MGLLNDPIDEVILSEVIRKSAGDDKKDDGDDKKDEGDKKEPPKDNVDAIL